MRGLLRAAACLLWAASLAPCFYAGWFLAECRAGGATPGASEWGAVLGTALLVGLPVYLLGCLLWEFGDEDGGVEEFADQVEVVHGGLRRGPPFWGRGEGLPE